LRATENYPDFPFLCKLGAEPAVKSSPAEQAEERELIGVGSIEVFRSGNQSARISQQLFSFMSKKVVVSVLLS
jgi:hypothetical protein